MLEALKNWFNKNIPEWKTKKYLVGVSGGMDSITLVTALNQLNLSVEIAHCNFQLRNQESEGDHEFVKNYAKKLELRFYEKRFNTSEYAVENKLTIQESARNLRYQWFENLRKENNLDYIVVGTHMSDETETLLINMIRGTGLKGTHGILSVKESLIRPFLLFNQEEIKEYAESQKLNWRDDSSNLSTKYLRNKLRHEVIPKLKEINPNIESKLSKNAAQVRESELLIQSELNRVLPFLMHKTGSYYEINKHILNSLNPSHLYLNEVLTPSGFSIQQSIDITKSLDNQPGGVFESETHNLLNDRFFLILTKKKTNDFEPVILNEDDRTIDAINLHISKIEAKNYHPQPDKKTASLDFNKLSFPLTIRSWKKGDSFHPIGMKGSKKISDLLIDLKIPKTLKSEVLVLESNGKIVWVIGHRINDRFKITPNTKLVYQLKQYL
ncbi:MAG: tRNA lysidine(34) synthetase TilS [Salibacteraceae bacterium]